MYINILTPLSKDYPQCKPQILTPTYETGNPIEALCIFITVVLLTQNSADIFHFQLKVLLQIESSPKECSMLLKGITFHAQKPKDFDYT